MNVSVKLFAVAAEKVGSDSIAVLLPEQATIADLRRKLAEECPALQPLVKHFLFAMNAEYAADSAAILADSEIACIPPVSGG